MFISFCDKIIKKMIKTIKGRKNMVEQEVLQENTMQEPTIEEIVKTEETVNVADEIIVDEPSKTEVYKKFFVSIGVIYENSVEYSQLKNILEQAKENDIVEIRINSLGGDWYEASKIIDIIWDLNKKGVITKAVISGYCISASFFIAIACKYVIARELSVFMIHKPFVFAITELDDNKLKQYTQMINTLWNSMLETLKNKFSVDTIYKILDGIEKQGEFWFSEKEALEMGIINEIEKINPGFVWNVKLLDKEFFVKAKEKEQNKAEENKEKEIPNREVEIKQEVSKPIINDNFKIEPISDIKIENNLGLTKFYKFKL